MRNSLQREALSIFAPFRHFFLWGWSINNLHNLLHQYLMCQLKVSSLPGRSQSSFDVDYFEIHRGPQQSRGAFHSHVCASVCRILMNVYYLNCTLQVCFLFVGVSVHQRPLSSSKPAEKGSAPPNCLQPGDQWGGENMVGDFIFFFLNDKNKWANTGTQLGGSHGYVSSLDEQHDGLFTPSGGKAMPQEIAH